MGYAYEGPSPTERRMFIKGIFYGAILSILGNLLITSFFRFIDENSQWNLVFLIFGIGLFIIVLYFILKLAKQDTK